MHAQPLLHIYAFDRRYSVPHGRTIEADPAEADLLARDILSGHEHYQRVDVWLDDHRLVEVERGTSDG